MTQDTEIFLPNDWRPRSHQKKLWNFMESGGKRAVAVWHRRAGKDSTALNWTAWAAHIRIGTYWHMLPTATQGRLVVWEGKDSRGRSIIDQAFPEALREGIRNDQMRIDLKCGSAWQVVGSDNYDRLVGANPIGVVFSEWSLTDPRAWDYVRPILAENGGWALFIFTPRGKNHGSDTLDIAKSNPDWFYEVLTVDDTQLISKEIIDDEKRSGMSDALVQQEYYCSFEAPNEGSYYGKLIEQAEKEGRVTSVPYQREASVDTWWDLGIDDLMSIWFTQQIGQEIHCIDHYSNNGEGLSHYAKVMQDKGYLYGNHYAPHDIEVRELGTGKSRLEVSRSLGINFKVAPKLAVEDGIEAVRNILPRCWFDRQKCQHGLKSLKAYHREFDEKRQTFRTTPVHDWSSHDADSFRTGAISYKRPAVQMPKRYIPPVVSHAQGWME